jgi:uncharacterized repeat protein (TIGR03803 family)
VFSLSASGDERVLHNFEGFPHDGAYPGAPLTSVGATLYGITSAGGKRLRGGYYCTSGCGTIFEVSAAGDERTLYGFSPKDGTTYPNVGLTLLKNVLYGTSLSTVYGATASGRMSTLYGFKRDGADGWLARGALAAVEGALYGTTNVGGANKYGTVFAVTTAGTESVLYSFGEVPDGRYPLAGLIDVSGTLYGTTESGGSGSCHKKQPHGVLRHIVGCGTVFEISTSGAEKVLYSFQGKTDGAYPEAGLLAVKGVLYGTTSGGGANDSGTVFSIAASGTESVLHSFGQGNDGSDPLAKLIDVNGTLYGTTSAGGTYGDGTVFALTLR